MVSVEQPASKSLAISSLAAHAPAAMTPEVLPSFGILGSSGYSDVRSLFELTDLSVLLDGISFLPPVTASRPLNLWGPLSCAHTGTPLILFSSPRREKEVRLWGVLGYEPKWPHFGRLTNIYRVTFGKTSIHLLHGSFLKTLDGGPPVNITSPMSLSSKSSKTEWGPASPAAARSLKPLELVRTSTGKIEFDRGNLFLWHSQRLRFSTMAIEKFTGGLGCIQAP